MSFWESLVSHFYVLLATASVRDLTQQLPYTHTSIPFTTHSQTLHVAGFVAVQCLLGTGLLSSTPVGYEPTGPHRGTCQRTACTTAPLLVSISQQVVCHATHVVRGVPHWCDLEGQERWHRGEGVGQATLFGGTGHFGPKIHWSGGTGHFGLVGGGMGRWLATCPRVGRVGWGRRCVGQRRAGL